MNSDYLIRLFKLTLLWSFFSVPVHSSPPSTPPDIPKFAPDKVLVSFQPGTPGAEKRAIHSQAGGKVLKTLGAIDLDVVSVPAGTVLNKVKVYQKNPNVKYAEPDHYRMLVIPNEGFEGPPVGDYFSQQWGLDNTGQDLYDSETGANYSGTAGADINAPEAWDISIGDPSQVIAVLDSGIQCDNVDIVGKCVDEQLFNSVSPDTNDYTYHGTHVAAIAAANTAFSPEIGAGVAGVAPEVKIANLKVCYAYPSTAYPLYGFCPVSASAEALIYAADQGYKTVNMSYGSDCDKNDDNDSNDGNEIDGGTGLPFPSADPGCGSAAENAALEYAWANDVLLVAAAGNSPDSNEKWPAAHPNVIAVAASDANDNAASFTTFGDWVDVFAPGVKILSAVPDKPCIDLITLLQALDPSIPDYDPALGCQDWFSGTSMASPHVAGIGAMVRSVFPSNSNVEVRNIIQNCSDQFGALGQDFRSQAEYVRFGRVNMERSLSGPCGAPEVTAGSDINADEGDSVHISPTFIDVDGGTHTATIDWGDGSSDVIDPAVSPLAGSHIYTDNGSYDVTVTVTDSEGGIGSDSLTATINNVAPTVNAGSDQSVGVSEQVTLSSTFSDPGSVDTFIADIDWGDSNSQNINPAVSPLTPNHTYHVEGNYTVVVTVTDDDGGISNASSLTVTVGSPVGENSPPEATSDNAETYPRTSITIDVISNDTDPDGNDLFLTNVSNGVNGGSAEISGGEVVYTPHKKFKVGATDTLTYTISDGNGGEDSADVTITIIAEPPDGGDGGGGTFCDTRPNHKRCQ